MPIKLAIAGIGNCASSLIQGIHYYSDPANGTRGLQHPQIGPYRVSDLQVVAAFDLRSPKGNPPVEEAIFAAPNNTKQFVPSVPRTDVTVQMGPILDGVPDHMKDYPLHQRFDAANLPPVDLAKVLRESGAQILVNYMPVGSQRATEAYAQACLDTGVSMVNCVPCFIVSDERWASQFRAKNIPCIGDDIKAQVGATITHRTLARLFNDRGVQIDSTYQLNTGGNTDFLNMLNRQRLASKKRSKTEAVQSQLDVPLDPNQIHIG